jgi:hypothetical protein
MPVVLTGWLKAVLLRLTKDMSHHIQLKSKFKMKQAHSLCNKITIPNPLHEAEGLQVCPHQIHNESHYFKSAKQSSSLHGLPHFCHKHSTITMANMPQNGP